MVHGPTGTSLRRGTDCESPWLFKHTLTFLFACFTGDNISNCCGSFPIFLLQVPIRPSVLLSPFHIRGKSRTLSYGSPHGGWGGGMPSNRKYTMEFFTCFQDSFCWSRGAASVLYVSCCLVLLPMCRNVLALIRNSNKVRQTTPVENLD